MQWIRNCLCIGIAGLVLGCGGPAKKHEVAGSEPGPQDCQYRTTTGSNIPTLICVPVASKEKRKGDDEKTLRTLQTRENQRSSADAIRANGGGN